MKTATDYKMIYEGATELSQATQKLFRDGWELYGTPFQTLNGFFAQAFVKYQLAEEPEQPTGEIHYVSGSDLVDLTINVTRHLKEGWKPFGSLVVDTSKKETEYHQAMTK